MDILTNTADYLTRKNADSTVDGATCILDNLLDSVVYFVLNYTPLNRDQRFFISRINLDNVGDKTEDLLNEYQSESTFDESKSSVDVERRVDVDLFEESIPMSLKSVWIEMWDDYFVTTRDSDGWRTWNNFLLKGCKSPRHFGLSWGNRCRGSYFYPKLSSKLALDIGLPDPTSSEWISNLLDIRNNIYEEQLRDSNYEEPSESHTGIRQVANAQSEMMPTGKTGKKTPEDRAARAIFHLVRCYAIWGGRAFLSIPVTFGTEARNRTAVLSLCTVDCLDSREIERWTLIAERMFSPVIADKALAYYEDYGRIRGLERMGHALKGVIQPTRWRKTHRKLREKARQVEDREVKRVMVQGSNALSFFSAADGFGELIRLIGYINEDEETIRRKTNGWINKHYVKNWRDMNKEITEDYLSTVFDISKIVCKNYGWPIVNAVSSVRKERSEDIWTVINDMYSTEEVSVRNMSMPPFNYQANEAKLSIFPAFVEPIKNAVEYLISEERFQKTYSIISENSHRKVKEEYGKYPLTIRAHKSDSSGNILIEVANITFDPPKQKPPGIKRTEKLLEAAGGMIEYDFKIGKGPESLEDCKECQILISIEPIPLAKDILQAQR